MVAGITGTLGALIAVWYAIGWMVGLFLRRFPLAGGPRRSSAWKREELLPNERPSSPSGRPGRMRVRMTRLRCSLYRNGAVLQ